MSEYIYDSLVIYQEKSDTLTWLTDIEKTEEHLDSIEVVGKKNGIRGTRVFFGGKLHYYSNKLEAEQ